MKKRAREESVEEENEKRVEDGMDDETKKERDARDVDVKGGDTSLSVEETK